jgi:hypothetical protein
MKRIELLVTSLPVITLAILTVGCTPAARTAPVEITADGSSYISCVGTVQVEKDSNREGEATYSIAFTQGTVTRKELHGVHNVALTKHAQEPDCDLMTVISSDHKTVKQVPPDTVLKGWEEAVKLCPLGNFKPTSGFADFKKEAAAPKTDDPYAATAIWDAPKDAVRVANKPLPTGACKWAPNSSIESAKADNWFVTESYHFVAADPVVFVGPSQTELNTDTSFQSAPQNEQIAYLSSVDPAFAIAPRNDQLAYLTHVKNGPWRDYQPPNRRMAH